MTKTDKEEAWEKMCEVAEALGLIVPETVPYLEGHARKIRKRLTLAENMLKLVVDLDHAYHSGWQGVVASQGNVAAAAKELIYGSDETAEKVYNVAWSGNRQTDADGNLPVVGNTVDVKNAKYTNTIGASELISAWTDPDFDPNQRAFYYGRVLEIPTPRWTAYDAVAFGVEIPDGGSRP